MGDTGVNPRDNIYCVSWITTQHHHKKWWINIFINLFIHHTIIWRYIILDLVDLLSPRGINIKYSIIHDFDCMVKHFFSFFWANAIAASQNCQRLQLIEDSLKCNIFCLPLEIVFRTKATKHCNQTNLHILSITIWKYCND